MTNIAPEGPRFSWAIAALAIAPYAITSIAVWAAPAGRPAHLAPWILCVYAAGLTGATGVWRLRAALRQGGGLDLRTLALAVFTPGLAVFALIAAPWIGFRWALTLMVAALSIQSLADIGGQAMPLFFRQIRAAVAVAGLICLLIGMLGA